MKVLWFTNTPSLAAKELGFKGLTGGWIESLEKRIRNQQQLDLAVAFYWSSDILKKIANDSGAYYLIPKNNNRVINIFRRIGHKIEPETDMKYFLQIIEDFKPDLIHIFGTEGPFGLVAKYTKIPVVIHIQGNITVCLHKWYSGISKIDVLKNTDIIDLILAKNYLNIYETQKKVSAREKMIFDNCKNFMGRTEWDKRLVLCFSNNANYYHCDEILRDEFYGVKWKPPDNNEKLIIITTIRNNIYKGLENVFETSKILSSKINFEIQIVGTNNNDKIVRLIEKKYKGKLSNCGIVLLGHKTTKEMIELLLNADVFIHPSHIDNSPNSVCEAMLLGMPIISTYAGGIPSLLENRKDGLLVQDGDPFALAGAIIELSQNKLLAVKLGINARIRAIERHNPEKIADEVIGIYRSLLNNNHSCPN